MRAVDYLMKYTDLGMQSEQDQIDDDLLGDQEKEARSKTRSSRKTWKPQRISFPRFSTPSFPFCTIPKTENSEMKTSECCFKPFYQTPSFSNSEFSILHCTQNGKPEMKTSESSFKPFYQTPSFSNSEFSILHYTQNGELGVGNLGVCSKVYQNSDFFKLLNQTPRFSNSELSILHYTQNGKLGDGKPRSLIRRCWRKLRGFHLRVFRFECSAKWKCRSWKTSEFDQSTSEFDETTSEQISEVFNSDFSVLGIVQNGKLGVENLGKLIL